MNLAGFDENQELFFFEWHYIGFPLNYKNNLKACIVFEVFIISFIFFFPFDCLICFRFKNWIGEIRYCLRRFLFQKLITKFFFYILNFSFIFFPWNFYGYRRWYRIWRKNIDKKQRNIIWSWFFFWNCSSLTHHLSCFKKVSTRMNTQISLMKKNKISRLKYYMSNINLKQFIFYEFFKTHHLMRNLWNSI